jgi:hypothetical protein
MRLTVSERSSRSNSSISSNRMMSLGGNKNSSQKTELQHKQQVKRLLFKKESIFKLKLQMDSTLIRRPLRCS